MSFLQKIALVLESDGEVSRAVTVYLDTLDFHCICISNYKSIMSLLPTMKCEPNLIIIGDFFDRLLKYEDVSDSVRQRCGDVPTIVLTEDASTAARKRAEAAGCCCMSKPVSPRILYSIIDTLTQSGAFENSRAT